MTNLCFYNVDILPNYVCSTFVNIVKGLQESPVHNKRLTANIMSKSDDNSGGIRVGCEIFFKLFKTNSGSWQRLIIDMSIANSNS